MKEPLSQIVSRIITHRNHIAAILEKYNSDYCSTEGHTHNETAGANVCSIDEAVRDFKNLYTAETNELDFSDVKLGQLTDYIIHTYHSYLKKEMPQILSYLGKGSFNYGSRHSGLHEIKALFIDLCIETVNHIYTEETVLFPRTKHLEYTVANQRPINIKYPQFLELTLFDLINKKENAWGMMNKITKLTNNFTPPEDFCPALHLLYAGLHVFEMDLYAYIHLEKSILFSKTLELEKQLQISCMN